jgi:glycosyltransferase involved in cell wall biosynthesis
VGTGFRPWRRGGLVAYVEDLVDEQARRGDDVTYLFAGRCYPFGRPRLRRWRHGGVARREIVNSPLYDHGRQPELELAEPRVERIVEREVRRVQPDVVHVHELCGLPSSVLEIAGCTGAPVIFTLQDYFALCPTFKLLDAAGRVCLRREVGADCVATVAAAPRDPALMYHATARHDLEHRLPGRWLPTRARARARARFTQVSRRRVGETEPATALAYQRRRDVNVERLSRVDRLIAMSHRVADIYAQLGVDPARLRVMPLTLAHIERLRPRAAREAGPITFATLGGGESAAKGARVLLDAWRAADLAGRARLLLFGYVDRAYAAEAARLPGVELRGSFVPDQLDGLLDEVDIGVMPSVWEEAYGYAGLEFLAKGIPVLANAIGGMTDYVREGETGWLNHSCDAAGLARVMRRAVERPEDVERLSASVRARRDELILPMSRHAAQLEEVYREEITTSTTRSATAAHVNRSR